MNKVGIIGLGIIGGSLAKVIHRKGLSKHVVAYNRNRDVIDKALQEGIIQEAAYEIDETFRACDIIFICVPVDKILNVVHKLAKVVKNHCILTDVGSTKGDIMAAIREISLSCPFIGGHPMAGSEASGYQAARHTLFENAYYVLTPVKGTAAADIDRLVHFITGTGALPIVIEPSEHDYATAAISHVPHVLASALVNTIQSLDREDRIMHTLAAGGFKDITRIASSSPEIWESICLANKENIIKVISELEQRLCDFKRSLLSGDAIFLNSFFLKAKVYRDSFSEKRGGALYKTYDIVLDVEDQPGVIAAIAGELGRHHINIKNIGINNSREMEGGALEICFYDRKNQEDSVHILKSLGYSVFLR